MEHIAMGEQKRDQQPSHASIPVQEWMDCLELGMGDPAMNEDWEGVVVVQELLEIIQ
jgi:hypothetical protein